MAELVVRPRVFLNILVGTEPAGCIVIELFSDKAPKTCENFRVLCTSTYTPPAATKPLSYKLSPFHRIIDGFMIQGGDITAGNGSGGQSIYGGEFPDENVGWRDIDKEGLVCMANRGKGTNTSQFFITLGPCQHLNAKHIVFGQVVSGVDALDKLAKVKVDRDDRPLEDVLISHCGELERRKRDTIAASGAIASDRSNGSNDRGRKRTQGSGADTHSTSRWSSVHSNYHRHKHHKRSGSPAAQMMRSSRRRSDVAIDETRRGRMLERSRSPLTTKQNAKHPSVAHHHRRKRSLSPSRSHSHGMYPFPHLRRRHTRSRSRSYPSLVHRGFRNVHHRHHRPDEDQIWREEQERDGVDGRFENIIDEDHRSGVGREEGTYNRQPKGRDGYRGGRLRYGGEETDVGGEVKFKGRGSMKYRERRW